MNNPLIMPREVTPLDGLTEKFGSGHDGLETMIGLDGFDGGQNDPENEQVCKDLYRLYHHESGQKIFEWLADLILRRRLHYSCNTIEGLAIQAAHQKGAEWIFDHLIASVRKGEAIIKRERNKDER